MSLNPVQFGAQVIDQFGRFLQTTFPVADGALKAQVREELAHDTGGERLIAKGPYVYLNRPFEPGPGMAELVAEAALELHPALAEIFPYETLHKHQELALRSIASGRHTIIATGTGSGKTEAFFMPIIDHCLKLRDAKADEGVAAVVIYPMNALADDQLRRLRPLLAGTGITFGRYTGATPEKMPSGTQHLAHRRRYTADELELLAQGRDSEVPYPYEECVTRQEIRQRRPRILLTNYAQLEYLLLRDRDLDLFSGAPLSFLVLDEVHTYTGVLGSEVAALIRRLRHVAGKTADDVLAIGTSATVVDTKEGIDAPEALQRFAHRLFGVPLGDVSLVQEHYRQIVPSAELYLPPAPAEARALLNGALQAVEKISDQPEGYDLPHDVLGVALMLCRRPPPKRETREESVAALLENNQVVQHLQAAFSQPRLISAALPQLRKLPGRQDQGDEELLAEVLTYLILGALVRKNGEPMLRPKLHYFIQGLQGLAVAFGPDAAPVVAFNSESGHTPSGELLFPVHLCRSCGQHYYALSVQESEHAFDEGAGYREALVGPAPEGFREIHLVDRLHTEDEHLKPLTPVSVCRFCGTVHSGAPERCGNLRCGRDGGLIPLLSHEEELKTCLACGVSPRSRGGVATPVQSAEVSDVTILAQSMLSAMPSEELRKLLIFADSRQDAAFQAGWMEERGRRYRLRHLLFQSLSQNPGKTWSLEKLTEDIVDKAIEQAIFQPGEWNPEDNQTRVRWFLLEEFASTQQRRLSLESLGLARIEYKGLELDADPEWFARWARELEIDPESVVDLLRTLLDYYRRRGVVSDPLLGRRWSYRDYEVRKGLVNVPEYFRPQALINVPVENTTYVKSWLAENGRAATQVALKQVLQQPSAIDAFLGEAWTWLGNQEFLRPTELVAKYHGKLRPLNISATTYQVNDKKMGITAHQGRYLCNACGYVQSVDTPNHRCPEYRCKGQLEARGIDAEHYDVVQYTQLDFAPLRSHEHSAQVPKKEREKIELEFKRDEGGRYNCLVATPTLEMGVDIGKLEMVLMRNVPPTPANYAQRAGRAGRRHRIAVVFSYCRGASHDRYFYGRPEEMIAGVVRVPAFSMQNIPQVRKHVHSAVLTRLRRIVDSAERDVLERAFPAHISEYFSEERLDKSGRVRRKYLERPRDISGFAGLIERHRDALLSDLVEVFQEAWPDEDAGAVSNAALASYLDGMPEALMREISYLHQQVSTYRKELAQLNDLKVAGELDSEEQAALKRYSHALAALMDAERQDNYTLSYLAANGFFPGYTLSRDAIGALSLDPYLELSRPVAAGLRELTPANLIYANKNVFKVHKLVFARVAAGDKDSGSLQQNLLYFPASERLITPEMRMHEGGADSGLSIGSYPLVDVELRRLQSIDDRDERRRRNAFTIAGMVLERHAGGEHGRIGAISYDLRSGQHLQLVNMGLAHLKDPEQWGFPICPICGETRNPAASETEIEKFAEGHKKTCNADVLPAALHVDLSSDALILGPFATQEAAVNLAEGIQLGARQLLDMGEGELESFLAPRGDGSVDVVLHDAMPGGSGFLPLMLKYWRAIALRAAEVLEACPANCDTACYSCLKRFRNQHYHGVLDRAVAAAQLRALAVPPERQHAVKPVVEQPDVDAAAADSDSELDFVQLCRKRGFPVPPASQYRVDLPNGSFTVADWAYPDDKVLVFIDGMSQALHGNPKQQQRDRAKRSMAKMKGFRVHEIPAEALNDEAWVGILLEEIASQLSAAHAGSRPGDSSSWSELYDLLDSQWHGLARELEGAGLPAPADVHVDLMREGAVHGKAILYWAAPQPVAVVEAEDLETGGGAGVTLVGAKAGAADVAARLKQLLGQDV